MTTLHDTTSTVNSDTANTTLPIVAVQVDADTRSTVHEKAIAEIVGMIRAKYEDEGSRNFAIGQRAFEHAQWQRGNFPDYQGQDLDNLMNRLRDDVRIHVAISAKSIKVGEWLRCYVLRSLVSSGTDAACLLSFFEYRSLYGKALTFSKKDVEGELNPGWLEFVREVVAIRAQGGRVSTEDFMARLANHEKAIADTRATTLDPVAAAAKVASEAIKAKTAAAAKSTKDITSSLSDGLSGGHVSADGALSILENVAKHHGIPLPSAMGFDPASCTVQDCELLASTMFASGKYAEMVALRDKLDKMVSAVDKARAAALATRDVKSAKLSAVA
ncbi:hypothetical protein [Singulisphaera acidiphila]|uniref:Uncharacterized protein n=1 Tax=Singulisphaera acidiphila (strain ATCC BAA-1392 / DSM 18658 / VKM B-2454 / MOB10) TaxID=886293 RepID=L0DB67_SINAD|nr:hypothetical protein [Singulisphaera acidiphila]AGA26482.1 hypothetical protein Sinac_2149 [Singulisphaera acidiphila DSM 18658]